MFQELTGMGKMAKLKALLHAPFTLHSELLKLIEQEKTFALAGKAAQIIIKVNALTEPQLIAALYQASQAGVKIDLIVRSICCLIPQVYNAKRFQINLGAYPLIEAVYAQCMTLPAFIEAAPEQQPDAA